MSSKTLRRFMNSKAIDACFWLSLLMGLLPPLPSLYGDAVDAIALACAALALIQVVLRLAMFYRNRRAA